MIKKEYVYNYIIAFISSIFIAYSVFFVFPYFVMILIIKYKSKLNPSSIISKTFAFLMLIAYPIIIYFFGTTYIELFSTSKTVYKFDAVTIYYIKTFLIQFVAIACLILSIKDDLKEKKKS